MPGGTISGICPPALHPVGISWGPGRGGLSGSGDAEPHTPVYKCGAESHSLTVGFEDSCCSEALGFWNWDMRPGAVQKVPGARRARTEGVQLAAQLSPGSCDSRMFLGGLPSVFLTVPRV